MSGEDQPTSPNLRVHKLEELSADEAIRLLSGTDHQLVPRTEIRGIENVVGSILEAPTTNETSNNNPNREEITHE